MPTGTGPDYVIAEWSGGGGIGHSAFLLAEALHGRGLRVTLATRSGSDLATLPHAFPIRELWPVKPRSLRGRPRAAAVGAGWAIGWVRLIVMVGRARRHGRIVVDIQAPQRVWELPFARVLRLAASNLIITAYNARSHEHRRSDAIVLRLMYRGADAIVAHNDETAVAVRALAGGRTPVVVIPLGSWAPIVAAVPSGGTRWPDAPVVAHLGAIRPYKGFDVVVEAVRRALEAEPALRFRVVGRPESEEEAQRLLARLPAGIAAARLEYMSFPDLVAEARAADVVVLGHRHGVESGIARLALACGTPVVAPEVQGLARLLAARPEWRYRPGDPVDAARALTRAIRQVRADATGTRHAACALVQDGLPTWREIADMRAALLERLGIVDARA